SRLRLVDLHTNRVREFHVTNLPQVTALALSPDGRRVLAGCQDGTIRLWALTEGPHPDFQGVKSGLPADVGHVKETRVSGKFRQAVTDIEFSPDGSHAYAQGMNERYRSVLVWDAVNWRDFRMLDHGEDGVTHAAFSPEGDRLLTGTERGRVRLWDIAT